MTEAFVLLMIVIGLAFIFDYINGFHDAANAIATVVSTNVLSPRTAILLAALFNFVGAFIGTGVAAAVGGDIADPTTITQTAVASALLAAITWNLVTWYFGLPSSSSHTLIGGLVGAVIAQRVFSQNSPFGATVVTLFESKGVIKILKGLVLSPFAGFIVGLIVMIALTWIVRGRRPTGVNRTFRSLQLLSSCSMALSHGSNDAQKVMGVATMALVSYYGLHPGDAPSWIDLSAWQNDKRLVIPTWIIISCATAMALGTSAGGWRIMKTMGHKIIKLRPIHGFAAETTGAIVLFTAAAMHVPVSTTHVISCSIMGVGSAKRMSAVRWGIAGNIVVAWILTIPVSAVLAGVFYVTLKAVFGV